MVQYIPAVLNGNVGDAESLMFIWVLILNVPFEFLNFFSLCVGADQAQKGAEITGVDVQDAGMRPSVSIWSWFRNRKKPQQVGPFIPFIAFLGSLELNFIRTHSFV
jgi:hypothetical protein